MNKEQQKQFDEHFKKIDKEINKLLRKRWYQKTYDWFVNKINKITK
jgi:hypothetical protein